jgi:type II secretory pathway pseudopilin PulG
MEMMIVIFIIGILSTVTAINVSAPNFSRFLSKAEQLSQSLAVLSDDAVYSGTLLACRLDVKSINCSRYKDGEWSDVDIHRMFSWGWPDGVTVKQVLVNGIAIQDKQTINFNPNGDNDSLAIEVTDGVYSIWIYGDLTGKYWVSS